MPESYPLDRPGAALLEGWSDDGAVHLLLPLPEETRELPWNRAGEWCAFVEELQCDSDELWAGFIAYEALACEEEALPRANTPSEPAAFFARHRKRVNGTAPSHNATRCAQTHIRDSMGNGHYTAAVERIRESIRDGDVYQVNLTRAFSIDGTCDPLDLYRALTAPRAPRSSAFLRGDGWSIVSASPEVLLRFDRETGVAESRPIKGTVRRNGDDAAEIATLTSSRKDASEHLMIVDVVRNDFGKIAPSGAVSVPAFRTVRTLEHVHHLESTVRATGLQNRSVADILGALSPAASITGAPKRAAVRMIRDIEPVPRGVYCGTIGYLDATRAEFSVAIRTAVVTEDSVRYHAGGGIVWDSDPIAEEDESRAKSEAFLRFVGAKA
ncbi:MAG TPA: anthranilate synthase component I family protein [Thermoanaerobaculia bacterium]|nr:anthranilate synthase component I family protein [Thermoanaerobaculia bacterium]